MSGTKQNRRKAATHQISFDEKLATAAAANDLDSCVRLIDQELQRATNPACEADAPNERNKSKNVADILREPSTFFTSEDAFGDVEIRAVRTALTGKDWKEFYRLAAKGEQKKLSRHYPAEKVEALIEHGWAWKHQHTLISAREKSTLADYRPDDSIPMVFVLRGYAWVPSVALEALALFELHIPSPSDIGNATGNYRAKQAASIRQQRAYADFLASHADGELCIEAESQIMFCDELLGMLKRDACPHVISAAMNVAYGSSRLRTLAESELLRDIITKHAAPRSRKPDRTGLRSAVENAYLIASEQQKRAATRIEVLAELTANRGLMKTSAGYQIDNREFDKFQLRNWLSRAGTRHQRRFPKKKGPGRPRKLP